jgi:hypothetical protein
VELLDDPTEQVSQATIMGVGVLVAALAAALLKMGYPVLALTVGPVGLAWLRRRGLQVRRASWFLAIGTSAVVVVSVFAHDGWETALGIGGVLACLGGLGWRKYRPLERALRRSP